MFLKQVDTPAAGKIWNTYSNSLLTVFDCLRECEIVYQEKAVSLGLPDLFPDSMEAWDSQGKGRSEPIVCPMQDCDIKMPSRHLFLGERIGGTTNRNC